MSEDIKNDEQDDGARSLAGERLAVARRDQDISLRDIAKELHLDESKVQELEQNNFESLGAPVFARGHLRKYAEIVGLNPDEIGADYDELAVSLSEPPIVGEPRHVARDIDLTRFIVPAVVSILFLLAVVVWFGAGSPLPTFGIAEDPPGEAIEIRRPVEVPMLVPSVTMQEQVAESPTDSPAEPVAETSLPEPAAEEPDDATPVAAEPPAAPSGPQVSLELTFSGNCWTEVTDAQGDRLFFDLGSEGRSVRVSGTAPLRVLFGSYENVSVTVDGSAYPIPASARRGETARFTVNAR